MDSLDELPRESRSEVVAAVQAAWHALEGHGGVDMWGGSEFCRVFPLALALVYRECNS